MRPSKSALAPLMLFWFVTQSSTEEGAAKPEYMPLDIVLVVDRSASISAESFAMMLNTITTLPNVFTIRSDQTRVAVVAFSNQAKVYQLLSGDPKHLNTSVEAMRNGGTWGFTATDRALKAVREQVLANDGRPEVTNIVIILTDGCTDYVDGNKTIEASRIDVRARAVQEAKRLRENGTVIYLLHLGKRGDPDCPEQHQIDIVGAGNEERRFNATDFQKFDYKYFEHIGTDYGRKPCKYEERCFYGDDKVQKCVGEWVKSINSTRGCKESTPGPVSCAIDRCESECKKNFYSDRMCLDACRESNSKRCFECRRCKTNWTSAHNQTGSGLGNGKKADDEAQAKTSQWLYIGIAIGALVLIAMLLVVTILAVRTRRRRKRRQEALAKLKSEAEAEERSHSRRSKSKSGGRSRRLTPSESKNRAYKTVADTFTQPATDMVIRMQISDGGAPKAASVVGVPAAIAYSHHESGHDAAMGVSLGSKKAKSKSKSKSRGPVPHQPSGQRRSHQIAGKSRSKTVPQRK